MSTNIDCEIWSKACSGMITDYADSASIEYSVLTGFFSNVDLPVFFGKVRTVHLEEGDYKDENIRLGLGFIDKLNEGDVLLVAGSNNFAYFGELMTRFSVKKKVSGVIINGATRDTGFTKTVDMPILYKSSTPVDIKSRGRVKSVDTVLNINESIILPNSFIFADSDAAVIFSMDNFLQIQKAVSTEIENEKKIKSMLEKNIPINKIIDEFGSF